MCGSDAALPPLLFALYGESLRLYVQRVAQHALGISIYYHIGRTTHSMYNPNIIHWLCQYICVFYAKNFFCMNRQYLFRGFWSREAFFDKTTEMFADLRSGCGRAASLADLRSGRGRAASPSRLRRAHSAFRAYGVPYKSKMRDGCFPLHRGSTKEPSPGKTPGAGPSLFIEKIPSLLFCYLRLHNRTRSVSLAYGVSYASKPQSACFALHVESSTKVLTQSLRCNVLRLHCPAGSCKRPCSGPACRSHRLCSSSHCRSLQHTGSSAHRRCRR